MKTKKSVFLTGTTGFVGSYLLKILLQHGHTVYALARGNAHQSAKERVKAVLKFWDAGALTKKVKVIEGDVASDGLGLDKKTFAALRQNIEEIYHCAAITDLNHPKDEIRKVNVEGTRKVLEIARYLSSEGRLVKTNHISTAHVYGDYQGVFTEESLDVGQKFSTNYEESKFQAELLVKEYRKKNLWVDIYRPSIVIGDSKTGKTSQFKHIYQFINLCKLELFDTLPILDMYASVVPIDLLGKAIYAISRDAKEKNKNYHPFPEMPVSIEKVVEAAAKLIGFKKPKIIPLGYFKAGNLTPAQKLLLQNSILSVNFRVTLDSSVTNQILGKNNCKLMEIDDNVLARSLKYFIKKNPFKK